ncbi:hypothetical protein KIN20_024262, partial [Parelaphostrongylus tenuis]
MDCENERIAVAEWHKTGMNTADVIARIHFPGKRRPSKFRQMVRMIAVARLWKVLLVTRRYPHWNHSMIARIEVNFSRP